MVAAVLLVATGAGEAAAQRAGKVEVRRAHTSGLLDLGKESGYRVVLSMPNDRVAVLLVFRIERRHDSVDAFLGEYAVHNLGSLARGVVRARLGSLGRVSLRFRPDRRVDRRHARHGCEVLPSITEHGRFVGHVAFRGEGGYLHLSLPGGAGTIERSPALRCRNGQAAPLPSKSLRGYVAPRSFFATPHDIALLYASSRRHGRYIGVTAGHPEGAPPGAELRMGMFESTGEMAVGRYALATGGPGTLLTSLPGVHPATATLAPPAPFFGEATYQEGAAASQAWTGNLGIRLPGLKLPLTGPRFHVRLCVLNPLKTRDGCDFFKAEPEFEERPARPAWMLR
ncbi:MAG: hypothetical protein ACTHNP_06535 [Solirubrobacterales bacterium]